jgi:hypothetical protein
MDFSEEPDICWLLGGVSPRTRSGFADLSVSKSRSRPASALICGVHEFGDLFSDSAVVIDCTFFHAIRADHSVPSLVAAIAAAPAIDPYYVYFLFCFHKVLARIDMKCNALVRHFLKSSPMLALLF